MNKKKGSKGSTSIRLGKDIIQLLEGLTPYFGETKSEVLRAIIKDWFKSERVQNELRNLEQYNQINLSELRKKNLGN